MSWQSILHWSIADGDFFRLLVVKVVISNQNKLSQLGGALQQLGHNRCHFQVDFGRRLISFYRFVFVDLSEVEVWKRACRILRLAQVGLNHKGRVQTRHWCRLIIREDRRVLQLDVHTVIYHDLMTSLQLANRDTSNQRERLRLNNLVFNVGNDSIVVSTLNVGWDPTLVRRLIIISGQLSRFWALLGDVNWVRFSGRSVPACLQSF